jgi:hypothetical protein
MTLGAMLVAARDLLVAPVWPALARGAWCRSQRRLLLVPGHGVLWVRPDAIPWAEWGAQRGYFELGRMDGLPYLAAMAAPAA